MIPRVTILFRPNNYRRQITIKGIRSKFLKKKRHHTPYNNYKQNPQNKHIYVQYSNNINLVIGKNTITAIYSQHKLGKHKETWVIERTDINEVCNRIAQIKTEIRNNLDIVLRNLISKLSLKRGYLYKPAMPDN